MTLPCRFRERRDPTQHFGAAVSDPFAVARPGWTFATRAHGAEMLRRNSNELRAGLAVDERCWLEMAELCERALDDALDQRFEFRP